MLLLLGAQAGADLAKPRKLGKRMLAFSLLGLAVLFTLIALHQYLSQLIGSVYTNLGFAAGITLIALILYLSIYLKEKTPKNEIGEQMKTVGRYVNKQSQYILYKHPDKILLSAAILGLLFGYKMRGQKKRPQEED